MKVGFIGLGTMGRSMAANLQKAGYSLVVNDILPQSAKDLVANGATFAATPREVAEACEVVFTSLPAPSDVEAVGLGPNGLAAGLKKGSAWFDLSTNAVDTVRRLHARMAEQGVEFLDAPVSGGAKGAVSGKLAIWIGGDKAVFERYKPVLDAMADQPRYIGAIGAGSVAKLVHNLAAAAINAVNTEAMTLGIKAGLEPLALWEAIRMGSAGRLRCFDDISRRFMIDRLDPPNFQLRLMHKDILLALQLGKELSVPLRLCTLASQDVTEAMNRDWGGRDSQSFLVLQQERAGIPQIKVSEDDVRGVMERS